MHATIPKGIVRGFVFTVFQRNLKEWYERPWTCLRLLKESDTSSFESFSVRNGVLIISHITFWGCHLHIFFPTRFLEIAVYGVAPPERGTVFRLQVYKRVGISLVGVFQRVKKSVVIVRRIFYRCKKKVENQVLVL